MYWSTERKNTTLAFSLRWPGIQITGVCHSIIMIRLKIKSTSKGQKIDSGKAPHCPIDA